MKKLVTIIAAATALAFVAAPITVNAAKQVKCYGVKCKKHDKTCKEKGYVMTTEKRCAKMHGSTTEPAAAPATTENNTNTNTGSGAESTGTGG